LSPSAEATSEVDARTLLFALVGRDLHTVDGSWNRILRLEGDNVIVQTNHSGPAGAPVSITWVQEGIDLLLAKGVVLIRPKVLRHRSAFVGAVLLTLPGVEGALRPGRAFLTESGDTFSGK